MSALSNEQQQNNENCVLGKVESSAVDYAKGYEQSNCIIQLQSVCRGHLARKKFRQCFNDCFIKLFHDENSRPSNVDLLKYGLLVVRYEEYYNNKIEFLLPLCEKIIKSISSNSKSESFTAMFLSIEYMQRSVHLVTRICSTFLSTFPQVNLNKITSIKIVSCATNFFYTLSSCSSWRLVNTATSNISTILETLCTKMTTSLMNDEKTIILFSKIMYEGLKEKKTILTLNIIDMLFLVVLRIFKKHEISNISNSFDEDGETSKSRILCLNFLICPALIFSLSPNTYNTFKSQKLFQNIIAWLSQNQLLVNELPGTDNLNLLANFINLSYLEHEVSVNFDYATVPIRPKNMIFHLVGIFRFCRSGYKETENWLKNFFACFPPDRNLQRFRSHWSRIEKLLKVLLENLFEWTNVINAFLMRCQQQLPKVKQRRNVNNWHHPILGWTSERIDEGTQGTFGRIRIQLSYLWSHRIVECLFGKVLDSFQLKTTKSTSANLANSYNGSSNFLGDSPISVELVQRVLNKLSLRNQTTESSSRTLPPVSMTAVVCQLYQNALITFSNTQIDILSGLCRDDKILLKLWNFVNNEKAGGIHTYISLLTTDPSVLLSHFSPLHLFADTAYSLISILDEKEMYESDRPFTLAQLREIARFTNLFCFKVIWEGIIDLNERRPNALFQSIYQLCSILHNRDCRRSFTSSIKNFWIVPEASMKRTQIIAEFERNQPCSQLLMSKMPHVVPLRNRMLLFRKFVSKDKEHLNTIGGHSSQPTTVITVDRTHIVEDGYRQLANISSEAFRGTIRVKFINQQGLDEAGIDQDGVFKEFLELTLKKVFDPELNLFKSTSNRLLYPSSISFVHENHLALFQFVGRMLAKAVYEGICVDVQLAPVLLATVLSKQLCPFDELATLDPVLYKNLTYVKHYNDSDDVRDLELNFSYDEEILGKVKTSELIIGGQDIEVNNENKIMYIHKMAQFRVVKQTKEQCEHFVKGFRSIINPKWLSLFNIHELQYIISGHTSDIDLEDLRKHTQYYGGFHGNHRVVKWLWSILQNDFSAEERQLFLKFVTSCSRPPLLGFELLEPPFSIRCVETSDDMVQKLISSRIGHHPHGYPLTFFRYFIKYFKDQGDTLGSIVRGFLAIKRKQPMTRLPTASTCFNLLKLPNYSKKSTLLEKLRYAIHAESGFELS